MYKVNDRVRFIDSEKDNQFGVLTIISIKGQIATCIIGDPYLASGSCNANLTELKKAE